MRRREFTISDKKERANRRDGQVREMEGNQEQLRVNIAKSKRLVDEADAMIRRHRSECETADRPKG